MNNYHQFLHPFTAIIAGPTGCGKTEFIIQLLNNPSKYIDPSPTKIYYYYGIWQERFSYIKENVKNIEFIEGLS
jgi:hypothetical protein